MEVTFNELVIPQFLWSFQAHNPASRHYVKVFQLPGPYSFLEKISYADARYDFLCVAKMCRPRVDFTIWRLDPTSLRQYEGLESHVKPGFVEVIGEVPDAISKI